MPKISQTGTKSYGGWNTTLPVYQSFPTSEEVRAKYGSKSPIFNAPFGSPQSLLFPMPTPAQAPAPAPVAAPASAMAPATAPGTPTGETGAAALLKQILQQTQTAGPAVSTTQAARSPELESQIADYISRLSGLGEETRQAYGGQVAAFDDVIRALSQTYGSFAGRAAGGAGTAALTSGLTPLEATGAGQTAYGEALQQYFPQLAGAKQAQAGVPVAMQEALRGLTQDYGSMLSSVVAPYQRGVAGTTTTAEDPIAKLQLMSQTAAAMGNIEVAEQANKIQMVIAQARNESAQLIARMGEEGADARAQLAASTQIYNTQLQQAGMDSRTSETVAGQLAAAQIQQTGAGARQQMATQAQMQQAMLPWTMGATPAEQARLQTQMGIAQMGEVGATGRTQLGEIGATGRAQLPWTMGMTPYEKARIEAEGVTTPTITQSQTSLNQLYRLQADKVIGSTALDPMSEEGRRYEEYQQTPFGYYPVEGSFIPRWEAGLRFRTGDPVVRPWMGVEAGGGGGAISAPPPGSPPAPMEIFSEEEINALMGQIQSAGAQ